MLHVPFPLHQVYPVGLTARNAEGAVEAEFANTGYELTDDQVSHVFDGFRRVAPSISVT